MRILGGGVWGMKNRPRVKSGVFLIQKARSIIAASLSYMLFSGPYYTYFVRLNSISPDVISSYESLSVIVYGMLIVTSSPSL